MSRVQDARTPHESDDAQAGAAPLAAVRSGIGVALILAVTPLTAAVLAVRARPGPG
jgi:hypothetical protein